MIQVVLVDQVSLESVMEAFETRCISPSADKLLSAEEITSCLVVLFDGLSSLKTSSDGTQVNPALSTDLVLNWLLNLYDQ